MREIVSRQIRDLELVLAGVEDADLESLVRALTEAQRIYVAGVGRSGDIVRSFAARLVRAGRRAHGVFEATAPPFGPDDLIVVGSGSGMTRTLDAVFDRCREVGAPSFLLTANALSPLARRADRLLVIPPVMPPDPTASGAGLLSPMQILFEQALFLILDAAATGLGATAAEPRPRRRVEG